MGSLILTCRGELIVSYEEANELIVYDMDSRRVILRIRKPDDPLLLEELLEDHDPWIIVSEYVPPKVYEVLRDMGLKVELTKKCRVVEYLENVFI